MSGHSKWSQIKRKKAVEDVKKGHIFSKITRIITLAAKEKGLDVKSNPKLRDAIEKAKEVNMPKENIERAIKKAASNDANSNLKELIFEGYGPYNIALIIETISDNKNRTLSELRHLLDKNNGKLAEEGSVKWLFSRMGKILAEGAEINKNKLELEAIEAGATDIKNEDDGIIILTEPENIHNVKNKIAIAGFKIKEAEIDFIPKITKKLNESQKEAVLKFFDLLYEQEDVQNIYSDLE